MRTVEKRVPLVMAGVVIIAALAIALFMALGGRSVVAGPDSGPSAAPPNPGHSWSDIGDLPGTMWHSNNDGLGSGLDADLLDGLDSTAFSTGPHTTSLPWTSITSKPAGFADDIDDDILGGLSCASGEIAKWDGSAWQCAADEAGAAAVSRPGFSTTTVDSAGDVGNYTTSVTVGVDALPLISYADLTNFDLKVAHCGNAACTAGNTITTVDSTGDVGVYSSVTVGADGLPVITYLDYGNSNLKVAHCTNATCTSSTTTTLDSTAGVGWFISLTVGADGLPVISSYDWINDDLKVVHCGNAACTSSTTTTVDSGGDVGAYLSVTVGADGLPVISYFDSTNLDLKVAHCGNAACTAGNTITTVDSAGTVGQHTSVTVGADGLPVISYRGAGDLKVAHCGNAACSAGNTITTVDSAGIVGEYTSVTVGVDGLPVISYYDYSNGDLKVAHCGNAACTSSTTATVDSGGDVGEYTAVTVGADGLPVISYYHGGTYDLKVAHCSNRFCVPYHRPR